MSNIDKLAKTLTASQEKKGTSPYDTTAKVVRVEGTTAWVSIPGGVEETPAAMAVNVKPGDDVRVRVTGGKAYVMGNTSSPPTDDTYAKKAQAEALRATAAAEVASQQATIAKDSADAAVSDAATAKKSADAAVTDAARANVAANAAQMSADAAQSSADDANEYAARALGNLSTVQSVGETLAWITQHGTMTLTTDTEPDPTHVYFVIDDTAGDYEVGEHHYSVVTEPYAADMDNYYELSIDKSLNNYVGTHLSVTSDGLWLIPDNQNGNRVLIATGAGSTYTTAGTYIIGAGGTVLAKFTTNNVQIGQTGQTRTVVDYHSMQMIDSDNDTYFHVSDLRDASGYATFSMTIENSTDVAIFDLPFAPTSILSVTVNGVETSDYRWIDYYVEVDGIPLGSTVVVTYQTDSSYAKAFTFGSRESSSPTIGGLSFGEGSGVKASGYCSHAEGYSTTASGNSSHAEGYSTTASSGGSHAEGYSTTASGYESHAEGIRATASGLSSHAEGESTTASGRYSHAQNLNTKASSDAQTAVGKYNVEDANDTYALIIGNGTSSTRSNALTVDWNGGVNQIAQTSIADNKPAELKLSVHQTDNDVTSSGYIRVYDDHDASADGTNMVMQSGGNMVIGSGESAQAYYNANLTGSNGEYLYLTSDQSIHFFTDVNGSPFGATLNQTGVFYPRTNGTGQIGSSGYRWGAGYFDTINSTNLIASGWAFKGYGTNDSTSIEIPITSTTRGFLMLSGAGANGRGIIAYSANTAGTVTSTKLIGASTVTVTNGTNKITLTNSSGAYLGILKIGT